MKRLLSLLLFLPLIALAQSSGQTLTLSWKPVTTMSDGSPILSGQTISYNIYGGHAVGGPFTLVGNFTGTSTQRTNVALGEDCYTITAVVNSVESARAPVACVNVAVSTTPATPAALTIVGPGATPIL